MKIICRQSELISALNTVARAAAPRSTKQILECVHMQVKVGMLTMTCTDLQMGIEISIPAETQEEGQVLLPVRLLSEFIRKLPDVDITIEVKENYSAVIRASGSRTTLQGMSADDFPALPEVEENSCVLVQQKVFRDMIRQTSFAVAVEDVRPILTGCLVEVKDGQLSVVALDGFRFAMRREKLSGDFGSFTVVVPGKYMNELARLMSDDDGEIALRVGTTHVALDLGAARVLVRLMDGEYIQYDRLVPQEHKMAALIRTDEFSSCLDRASLMAREGKSNLVKLHFEERMMQLTSNSEMGEAFETMQIEWQGEDLDIAFDVRYTNDVLKNIDTENVYMKFSSPLTPCVIVPQEGDSFLYLLLPVRVYAN